MKKSTSEPLVSVCCITYNHEPYIRDAIEGFLMQKTSFPFEIIIHDDASTDRTQEIILEYKKRYPKLIKTILQKENQYSKGKRASLITMRKARGKYIALCEGDDYWSDPRKLQKQVDLMDDNPEYSLCFHPVQELGSTSKLGKINKISDQDRIFGEKELFKVLKTTYSPTSSLFFRRKDVEYRPEWLVNAPTGDIPLKLLLLSKGKAAYISKPMSVYRTNVNGSWTSRIRNNKQKQIKLNLDLIELFHQFNKHTKYRFNQEVLNHQANFLSKVIKNQSFKRRLAFLNLWIKRRNIFLKFPLKNNLKLILMVVFGPIVLKLSSIRDS